MNDKIEELYNNLDAKDKIINEQVLEIARLKDELENDIDRYEDTISYLLGFDKGKEYMQQKIDKAIEEIECEIERYDGSNEDFISASWVEMKTDDYIAKLKNILEILGGKENES